MAFPQAHEVDPVLERVAQFIDETGLGLPGRPAMAFPRMPANPADIGDHELMERLAATNAWCEHLDWLLGIAEAETSRRVAAESLTEARAIRDSRESSMKGRERMAELDENRLAADRQKRWAYEHEVLLRARLKGLERIAMVLSRELTRRTSPAGLMRGSATSHTT